MEELPRVLLGYRTTVRKPTDISPFTLTYGMKAIITIEISLTTIRTATPQSENAKSIARELDVSDELREAVTIRITSYQRRLENSYNRRVKPRVFRPSDLVLRKVFENTTYPIAGKFQPKWDGLYVVTRTGEVGSYAIDKTDGTPVPRMWNATHLRRYYQ